MISGIRKKPGPLKMQSNEKREQQQQNNQGQILRKWTPKIRVQEKHLLKFWHLILYSDHCPYISVAKIRFFVCIYVCIKFSQCDKLQMKTKLTIHYPPCIHALCNVTCGSYLPELESNTSPFESELAWWIPLPKWTKWRAKGWAEVTMYQSEPKHQEALCTAGSKLDYLNWQTTQSLLKLAGIQLTPNICKVPARICSQLSDP